MGRKLKEGYHESIYELLELLSDYSENGGKVGESDFQDLFEKHNHLWAVLGYSDFIAQPKCELINDYPIEGEYIEPDFLAYSAIKKQWEIVDLKLPKDSISLSNRNRRKRFRSDVEDYIAQIDEYVGYFNESAHRNFVKSEFDVEISPNPSVVLILGSDLNQNEIDKHLDRYDRDISIIPYNRILDLLYNQYLERSGEAGGLPGLTIASRISLVKEPTSEREYIFNLARSGGPERVSLFLTGRQELCLEISTQSRTSVDVSVPWKDVFEIGEQKVLYLEFATTEEMSLGRVFAGSKMLDEMLITAKLPFEGIDENSGFQGVEGEFNLFVGADQDGDNGATFMMHDCTILSKLESLDERIQFMRYLQNQSGKDEDRGVFFKENTYMWTEESSDLERGDSDEEVIWRDNNDWITNYRQSSEVSESN